jgi:hypothetical protein
MQLLRFIIFVIDGGVNTATGNEMADIDAFNAMLEANGHWITAAGINHGIAATLIDNRDGVGVRDQGSLQTGPEHYSGFWLIRADSIDQAQELAMAGSKACNRKVELRPYLGQ